MAQSVQEAQRTAILRMLSLAEPGEQLGGSQTWKVLVYDKFCQEVVAPLLKVGGLRNHGVTLHLNINSERLPVADVPAVYFVEPTTQNIKKIGEDLSKGLYESCYVNFASSVTRSLLEELAKDTMEANAAQKVMAVVDRYVSFVSLSPSLFSLNLPAAYETLHSPLADEIIGQYIERIVAGLLSVLVTMRSLPIIRCPPGYAAEMIGRRLEERIRELRTRGGAAGAELFSGVAPGARGPGADSGSGPGAASQRPLLCILDRDVDLVTMLNHTWTYQAMTHDVLGLRLNRLTVPVEGSGDSVTPPKAKSYDVDESDGFWAAHAGHPFPVVAEAVHESIEEFNRKRADMSDSKGDDDPSASLGPGLAAAINALPEMTEKKRSIDMHTNIATALLNEVKARELDRYYEMEDQFASQSTLTSISQLEQMLKDKHRGTTVDKTRALMVLYLTKSLTAPQLQGLVESLRANGGDESGIAFLQHLAGIRNMMVPSMSPAVQTAPSGAASLMGSALSRMASAAASKGEGLLQAGMANVRNVLASKKTLVICQILDGLMEQKGASLVENYLYLDPKAQPSNGDAPRMRAPFRKAIAFVVGGGNYAEMQSVQEWAQERGRQVVYGATDLVSPTQFVDELSHLGQAHGGGGADLR